MGENLLQIPLFDQFRNQIGNFCITLYIQSLVWLWDSMMDLAKFNRIFVSNEHIQKIVSCMLNFARSIIESHNHNQTNDWMYNVMQKLPIWLQNWSKSGICKRFSPFGTYITKSWSKFFVFQYIFVDNLIPKNIFNIRDSLYIFSNAYICYWKEKKI